ncbi:MAG: hypothetical protein E6749_24050, partial [Enterocloster clostridioformis]|uniref:hypothetical protein n=1 Tax=Enterocloster clostridioformis TaxID=1531 RepID=UPI00290410BD
ADNAPRKQRERHAKVGRQPGPLIGPKPKLGASTSNYSKSKFGGIHESERIGGKVVGESRI